MTDKHERAELELLRHLRKAVEDAASVSTMYFLPNRTLGEATHLGAKVEIPVPEWDELMDALGDLEGFDLDPEAYS